jgi:ATP-binding cassette, subfamily B, bacterial
MRLLLRYLRQRPRLLALSLICACCNQVFVLLDPLIFRYIIDGFATQSGRYTTGQFFSWAGLLLAAALGAALIAWVAKSFQLDAVNRITRGVGVQLYSDAVRHSLGMPYSAFESRQSGEIMALIQTARHDVERFLTLLINTGFTAAIAVIFVFVYAARVNWILAPALLLATPVLGFASYLIGGRMRDTQRDIVIETSRMAGSAAESLRNIEIVKSLGLSKQEVSRLDARSGRILEMEVRKIRRARYLTFFHGACVNLLRSGLVLLFFYLVFTKQITMGQFFSLFFYSYFIFSPMQETGTVMSLFQETEASLKNIESILEAPQETRPDRPTAVGSLQTISFRGVTFRYPSGAGPGVHNISFDAARGETIAFVGPSGSGKTTLVKLLAGLYSPDSGEIAYNAIPASHVDFDEFRERIGLVTQDTQLFSGTIRDNLVFVKPDATDEDCFDALRQAAATHLLVKADKGLDTIVGEGGVRVSGGERQKISIARALLRGPELLVFDEATSSLDSLTEEEIIRTMKAVHRQRQAITIVIAHRLSTVRHADRIYVLNRGSITETGKHEELLERRGLYRDLWQQQTGGAIAQTAG